MILKEDEALRRSRCSVLIFFSFAAIALGGCAARRPSAPVKSRPAPLRFSDEETEHLISMALSVAVDGGMGDCPGDTCLLLNSAYVYRLDVSYESLSEAALPPSDSTGFVLISREDVTELLAEHNTLEYIEITRVAISDDEATVDVSFWSVSSRGLFGVGSAKGPSLLFRKEDGDWAFVEVKGWVAIN